MKVDFKGHTVIIKETQGDIKLFIEKVAHEYNSYKTKNIILDLTPNKATTLKDIKEFSDIAKQHKKEKKSLVIVVENINYNQVPDKLIVVPTLLEAHDIIEMDEIERDLGF